MPSPERTQMAADNLELRVIEVLDRLYFYDDPICHDEVGPVETEFLLSVEDGYQLFWP